MHFLISEAPSFSFFLFKLNYNSMVAVKEVFFIIIRGYEDQVVEDTWYHHLPIHLMQHISCCFKATYTAVRINIINSTRAHWVPTWALLALRSTGGAGAFFTVCTKCVCHSCHLASFVGVVLYLQDELGLDALGAVDALHRGVGAAVLDGSPLKGDLPLEHGHHEVTVQEGVGLAVRQSWEDTRKGKVAV